MFKGPQRAHSVEWENVTISMITYLDDELTFYTTHQIITSDA